jgi:hypothetical protein
MIGRHLTIAAAALACVLGGFVETADAGRKVYWSGSSTKPRPADDPSPAPNPHSGYPWFNLPSNQKLPNPLYYCPPGGTLTLGIENNAEDRPLKSVSVYLIGDDAKAFGFPKGGGIKNGTSHAPTWTNAKRYTNTAGKHVLQFTMNFSSCMEWEWVQLQNTSKRALQNVNIGITAGDNCEVSDTVGTDVQGDGVFGGSSGMVGDQRITEIVNFPENVPVDMFGPPPFFNAAPETGVWTAEFVFEDPRGEPRPLGGVRYSTDGPGLAPGDMYSFSFSMVGEADEEYAVFALDTDSTEWLEFRRDTFVYVRSWRSVRSHAGIGNLAITIDPVAANDQSSGPGGVDAWAAERPTVEPRASGGVQRIEIDLNRAAVLIDPSAVKATDGTSIILPDIVVMEEPDKLVAEFLDTLVDEIVYKFDIEGAIEDLQGDLDAHIIALESDVSGDGVVSDVDADLINEVLGAIVDEGTAKFDLDLDGLITPGDVTKAEGDAGGMVICPGAFPTVPWYEDFDDYDPGTGLHGGCGWKGWEDDPAFDAPVTQEQAKSPSQSV